MGCSQLMSFFFIATVAHMVPGVSSPPSFFCPVQVVDCFMYVCVYLLCSFYRNKFVYQFYLPFFLAKYLLADADVLMVIVFIEITNLSLYKKHRNFLLVY